MENREEIDIVKESAELEDLKKERQEIAPKLEHCLHGITQVKEGLL